jgi:hypothetical protein
MEINTRVTVNQEYFNLDQYAEKLLKGKIGIVIGFNSNRPYPVIVRFENIKEDYLFKEYELKVLNTKNISNVVSNDKEKHRQRHIVLHSYLDEIVADYMTSTKKLASESTIMDLLKWSQEQTLIK